MHIFNYHRNMLTKKVLEIDPPADFYKFIT